MRLGVLHGHFGKLAEGDGLAANPFRELDLAPRIGFALLVEREGIALATDLLSVPISFDVIVDLPAAGTNRAFEYAFDLWSAVSLHSTSDASIVPTGTKRKCHQGTPPSRLVNSLISVVYLVVQEGFEPPAKGLHIPDRRL